MPRTNTVTTNEDPSPRIKKRHVALALLVCALLAAGLVVYLRGFGRIAMGLTLFRGVEQVENFSRAASLFPSTTMPRSKEPFRFPEGERISLPAAFEHGGATVEVEEFLSETDTSALLVLKDGEIRFERYYRTGGPDVRWLSWSVAKSFISALVGIAVDEGHIRSIEEPISEYVPRLRGSGYEGVRIKDVLQMSSGVRWDETYINPLSDVNRFGAVFFLGGSLDDFTASLERERPPGTHNHYCSADTHALGMLLKETTGRSVTDYMREKLWEPLGMESAGRWLTDDEGMEMVFGGLNATARDYAKFGELYRLRGAFRGAQVVPEAWVEASVTPDAPHLTPEAKAGDVFPVGYGYQWWIPAGGEGEYAAIGIYNQFIYVNPTRDVVIVKLSAFSGYALGVDESAFRELETIEFFRAIARSFE